MKELLKKLVIITMLLTLAASIASCGKTDDKDGATSSDKNMMPDFEAEDFKGNKISNKMFKKNSVTVMSFWFNGCSACIGEMQDLEQLNNELKAKGGAVVGVSVEGSDDNEFKEAKAIMEKKKATFTNIRITSGQAMADYINEIYAFPTTVFVNREGRIIGEPLTGTIDRYKNEIQKRIDETVKNDAGK